jgi:hypothetical protein
MAGVPQSKAELEQHLQDHLGFIRSSADAFDGGNDGEAKRLATSLRVLFHDTSASKSLLGQLGRLGGSFLSTSFPLNEKNLLPHGGLVVMGVGGGSYLAMLDDVPFKNWLRFPDWWNEPVFVDDKRERLSRRQLVLAVANQDGGAHVDPSLNETYARLSRHNSLGWVTTDGTTTMPLRKPERAAIRQIAHESLATLVPGYRKVLKQTVPLIAGGVSMQQGSALPIPVMPRKTGRNEPCPCGSGHKYKRCHGAIRR